MRQEKACIGCHFFVWQKQGSTGLMTSEISKDDRDKIHKGNRKWSDKSGNYCCYHTVWNEDFSPMPEDMRDIVIKVSRDDCFFWPFSPGMQPQAAEVLQKREAEMENASTDRKHTIWGLRIAAAGLVVVAVFSVLEFFCK